MIRRLAIPLLALLLAACASQPPRAPVASRELAWQERQTSLQRIDRWQLTGRLALQSGDEGGTVTLIWQQQPESYQIRLVAPLGQGSLQLEGDADGVILRNSEGRSAIAANAETLLQAEVGWRIPVKDLRYWVVGLAAPGNSRIELDQYGRLARLNQDGWEVTFLDYTMVGNTELPARIFVTDHQARVRLIIKRWELADASHG
jgi:outer membrane lipoprotein LolB